MELQKVIVYLCKFRDSGDPDAKIITEGIKKVEIEYEDFNITIKEKPASQDAQG